MARRKDAPTRPSAYDSLIDAERDALIQAGRTPTRHDLTQALIEAAGLSPREARRAVDDYLYRRGGRTPRTGRGWLVGMGLVGLILLGLAAWCFFLP